LSVFEQQWLEALEAKKAAGLWRHHRLLTSPQGVNVCVDGRQMLAFCSNDYLGLANHKEVKQAALDAIQTAGVGSGASHLVIGHHQEHDLLESELATFTNRDRALIFSSGYMANLAVISTLLNKSDLVLEDKLNHASLIDGGLLSGARFQRYLHNDINSLSNYLQKFSKNAKSIGENKPESKTLVVTDGVFSMDGDVANLVDMVDICKQQNALLMVDDAHGMGVLGPGGRGCVAELGLSQTDVPVLVGTFGKAFGTSGAFVAGSETFIEYLIQCARPYIYTTAMPPSIVAATRKSLQLIQTADQERAHLSSMIHYFREKVVSLGYQLMDSSTPIQPILIGSSESAVALSDFLAKEGVLVTAIRPPTVPDKTARLRVTFSAAHTKDNVDQLLVALAKAKHSGVV